MSFPREIFLPLRFYFPAIGHDSGILFPYHRPTSPGDSGKFRSCSRHSVIVGMASCSHYGATAGTVSSSRPSAIVGTVSHCCRGSAGSGYILGDVFFSPHPWLRMPGHVKRWSYLCKCGSKKKRLFGLVGVPMGVPEQGSVLPGIGKKLWPLEGETGTRTPPDCLTLKGCSRVQKKQHSSQKELLLTAPKLSGGWGVVCLPAG